MVAAHPAAALSKAEAALLKACSSLGKGNMIAVKCHMMYALAMAVQELLKDIGPWRRLQTARSDSACADSVKSGCMRSGKKGGKSLIAVKDNQTDEHGMVTSRQRERRRAVRKKGHMNEGGNANTIELDDRGHNVQACTKTSAACFSLHCQSKMRRRLTHESNRFMVDDLLLNQAPGQAG